MGGDGGTLNNSRRDHVRLRKRILGAAPDASGSSSRRASVTECALSKLQLAPPHVVVDRAGNLYNKEALLRYILARRLREGTADLDAFAHIRSMKRDTAAVNFVDDKKALMCPVTRKVVFEEGGFTVGWKCGCVAAPVHDVAGMCQTDGSGDQACIVCGEKGFRVRLGATLEERRVVLEELGKLQRMRQGKKKRKVDEVKTSEVVPKLHELHAEGLGDKSPVRKVARMTADCG